MDSEPNGKVIESLLQAGHDVDVNDKYGTSFLAWVVLTGSLHIFPVIASYLPIAWLDKELPVISAILEWEEKGVVGSLRSRRLFSLALAHAIARVKKTQHGPKYEDHQANVPLARPPWLPSEEQFSALLFARSICGTQVNDNILERARKKCMEACTISPWDPPWKDFEEDEEKDDEDF
jgi:hypothetical protein